MASIWDSTCQSNQIATVITGSQLTSGARDFASFRSTRLPGFDDQTYDVEYPLMPSSEMLALLAAAESSRGASKIAWTPPEESSPLPFVIKSFKGTSHTDKKHTVQTTFIRLRGVTAPS